MSLPPSSRYYTTPDGVLTEVGLDAHIHDRDGALFKGIFMRNLRILYDASPRGDPQRQRYAQFIRRNVASATARAKTAGGLYGSYWQGPVDASARGCQQPGTVECGNATGATPQISALLLLAAAPP